MAKSPLIVLLFLCCFSLLLPGGAVTVRIGALINPYSRIGREQRVAIEIATKDFNSSLFNLSLNISDSGSKAERLIEEWGANAIISTLPWPEVVQIAKIGIKRNVPVLTLTASQPLAFASEPNIFQMSRSASGYAQCLADLVKLFNWRQVIMFYEDDNYGSTSASVIPLLNDALRAVGSEISARVAFPPLDSLSNAKGMIHEELEKLQPGLCKVFIIARWSSPSLAAELFKEAGELGMMDTGHVWIAGDDITTLLDSTFNPPFLSSYMQGVIGIKPYWNESRKPYRDFSSIFRQKFREEYSKKGEAYFEPGMSALKAYDAVHVIALKTYFAQKTLLEGMQSISFVSLSGQIRFGRNGSLMEGKSSSAYRVINVVGKSYREIGFWIKGKGFYKEERDITQRGPGPIITANMFGTIYWPGGKAEKVPGGWRKLMVGVPMRTVSDKFVKMEYNSEGKLKHATGFCIEVYEEARKLLNYELPYKFIPFNGTYDELVASVPVQHDAAVGDITTLVKRMVNVTFTEPYLPSGLVRLVPGESRSKQWVLTKPFSGKVWLLIAISYLYTCAAVWYLERKQNPEFSGPWRQQLGATLWLIFCTIFFAHGKIHSYYTKAVVAVWLFVLLVLTTTYTASLGSILVTENLEPVVNDQRIGCNGASFVVNYLEDVMDYKKEQIAYITELGNYHKAFQRGEITMAYLETPYLKVFPSQDEAARYTVYGDTRGLGGLAFVFPKNSPLAADFSKAILQLSENGTLTRLQNKWFSPSLDTCPNTCKNKTRVNLDLGSLWVLFLLTLAVSTVVLLLFKSRFFTNTSCQSIARIRCVNLRNCKLRSWQGHLCRCCALSSTRIASQGADANIDHNTVNIDEQGSLPNQLNSV